MLTNGRIMPRTDIWLGYDRTNHKKKDVHGDAGNRRYTSFAVVSLDLLLPFEICSQHMNCSELTCSKSTQLQDAFIGHARQRHDVIGCGETGTVGAQSVLAL